MWRGAEAVIYKIDENTLLKERVKKGYRIEEIDRFLRRTRTKKEFRLIKRVSKVIDVPKVFDLEEFSFKMEYIKGKLLRDIIGGLNYNELDKLFDIVGKQIDKMHKNNVVHGDLTTSNMILLNGKVYFIDFSLGSYSTRIEDKAVDLHLIKQALIAKHNKVWERCFNKILENYTNKHVLERLKAVEKRGRKKG